MSLDENDAIVKSYELREQLDEIIRKSQRLRNKLTLIQEQSAFLREYSRARRVASSQHEATTPASEDFHQV